MITKKKVVLVLRNERIIDMIRFEAIEVITREEEIEKVWKNNKTPLFLASNVTPKIKRKYEILEVPAPYIDAENFIAYMHFHGVECGEYMNKEKYDTSKEDCFLCNIANYGAYSSAAVFNRRCLDVKRDHDIIIYDTTNFFVKIELGCIKPGMVMINPKKHILSAAQIPGELVEEYESIKRDIEFLLKGAFGDKPIIFFEHGSAPDGMSSHQRSIVHAHTHVAWDAQFPQKYLDMVCLEPTDIKSLSTCKYLSYQEGTTGTFFAVADSNVYVQRQYPRQVIAEIEGVPNEKSNWRVEPFTENMNETFLKLYNFLINNQEFISPRILKATKCFVTTYHVRVGKS